MTTGLVSVIVPTRDNARTIEACLASVTAQTHRPLELIVVDNSSTDGTRALAARHADVVLTAGPERSAQRNTGIEASRGEWFLWLDSDMVLPPDAIELALRTGEETGATGVALPERTIGAGYWTACRALERSCYLDVPWLHNPRLIRRSFFDRHGGFGLDMSGPEDADLRLRMLALGETVALAPVIVDHDEGRLTLRDVWRKRYYYGLSIPALARRHDAAVARQGRTLLTSYVRHWRDLAADPMHAVGMVVMRSMEAVGYGYGAWRGGRR